MVTVVSTNLLNKKGETTTVTREFATLNEAQKNANYLASAKSVLEVVINDGNEITVVKGDATKEEGNMVTTQITKDAIRKELKALGIELSESKFNRTKKEVLIAMLEQAKTELEADVQEDAKEQIENHELMHGTQEVQEKTEVVQPTTSQVPVVTPVTPAPVAPANPAKASNEAKAKTDKLFALIKEKAADNIKKGFGCTISSFMLQAVILEAGTGLKKLKGHTVTEEENKLTWDIYKWLKGKGFLEPVVYSVKEDENVRLFMPKYPGKTENTQVKMIPYAKSQGKYTPKKATSFLVTIPGFGTDK